MRAKRAVKFFLPAAQARFHQKENASSNDALLPVYGIDREVEARDIAYPGKRMEEGGGHWGGLNKPTDMSWADWKKQHPELLHGYSFIGVPWDIENKVSRRNNVRDALSLLSGHTSKAQLWEGNALNANMKPEHQDDGNPSEGLLSGFRPSGEIKYSMDRNASLADVFDQLGFSEAEVTKSQLIKKLRELGLKPRFIEDVFYNVKPTTSGKYELTAKALNTIKGAFEDQSNETIADDMVNRRPTRQWDKGGFVQALDGGGFVQSLSSGGTPSKMEENKLVRRAVELRGSPDMQNLLIRECEADGYESEAEDIVNKVITRVYNSETGKKGNALKKAHDPTGRFNRIKSAVKGVL